METSQRLSLVGFTLEVFFDRKITFFCATKQIDEMRPLLLVWKKDEGFQNRLILKDPNSDAETTKPLPQQAFQPTTWFRPSREVVKTFLATWLSS